MYYSNKSLYNVAISPYNIKISSYKKKRFREGSKEHIIACYIFRSDKNHVRNISTGRKNVK